MTLIYFSLRMRPLALIWAIFIILNIPLVSKIPFLPYIPYNFDVHTLYKKYTHTHTHTDTHHTRHTSHTKYMSFILCLFQITTFLLSETVISRSWLHLDWVILIYLLALPFSRFAFMSGPIPSRSNLPLLAISSQTTSHYCKVLVN